LVPVIVVVGAVLPVATEYPREGVCGRLSAKRAELTIEGIAKVGDQALAGLDLAVAGANTPGAWASGCSAPQTSTCICVTRLV